MTIIKRDMMKNKSTGKGILLPFLSLLLLILVFCLYYLSTAMSTIPTTVNNIETIQVKIPFVTIVMPSVVNPDGQIKRIRNIAQTWGHDSRAIFIVHLTEAEIKSGNKKHPSLLDYPTLTKSSTTMVNFPAVFYIPSTITPDMGVKRLQYILSQITTILDPDFTFWVNDHTYVLSHHLCSYIKTKNSNEPLYIGHALKKDSEEYAFNSGASGYLLSKYTMKQLIQEWNLDISEQHPQCQTSDGISWYNQNPGLILAKCLHYKFETYPIDTRSYLDQSHVFHAFGISRMVTGDLDEWYRLKHKTFSENSFFGESFRSNYEFLPTGSECCSVDTLTFHYVEAEETLVIYDILQYLNLEQHAFFSDVKNFIQNSYNDIEFLGGYSRPLPPETEEKEWDALLDVFQKLASEFTEF